MEKILLLFSILFILSSCRKSEEEKFNDLIAETTKASLYIPESYDPVSTDCDSMHRAVITRANIKKSAKLFALVRKAESLQREIEMNIEQREYWRGTYGDFYSDYAKKVERDEAKKAKLMSEASQLFSELSKDYFAHNEFCGYLVDHNFRAKNNMGNVMFGEVIYILNKDKTEIVDTYDATDDDFVGFIQLIDAIIEVGENYSQEKLDLTDICNNI